MRARKLLVLLLVILEVICYCSLPVFADIEGGDTIDYDTVANMQNGVTSYALRFAGDGEVKYIRGGRGGRAHPDGENNGYWSLEQVKQYHYEYSEVYTEQDAASQAWARYGTDCSGFVSAVFEHCELYNPEWGYTCTSYATHSDWKEVTSEEARPGDLVIYWKNNGSESGWSHMEMYIGEGLMVGIRTSFYHEGSPNYVSVTRVYSSTTNVPHYFRAFEDESVLGVPSATPEEMSIQISLSMVKESELEGMVENSLLWQGSQSVSPADRDKLSKEEILNLEKIKELKDNNKLTVEKVTTIVQTTLGIFVLAYAFVLLGGLLFDRVNTVFDVSLVTLFSFGYIKVARRDDYDNLLNANGETATKKGYMTVVKFMVIEVILIGIGSALVSGVVFYLIIKLLSLIGVY